MPRRPQYLLILLVLFHLIFAFEGGDYFHYYEKVSKSGLSDAQEPIYHWLARIVCNNYILWRLIVWGSALMLFMSTARRLRINQYKVVFLLYVMYFTVFDYARASLGMAMYFYGLSFWCKPIKSRKWMSYAVIGPIIMYCSTFFHSSMYLACAATMSIFIPFNKKLLITILLLLFIFSTFLHTMFNNIIGMVISSDTNFVASKVEEYSLQEAEFGGSVFEQIRRYVEYATFFIPAFMMTFFFLDKKNANSQYIAMLRLFKVMVGIMLIAVSMLMVSTSIILFYRILFISMLAVVLLFYYCRKEHMISNFSFCLIIIICLLQVFLNFSKRILGDNIPW